MVMFSIPALFAISLVILIVVYILFEIMLIWHRVTMRKAVLDAIADDSNWDDDDVTVSVPLISSILADCYCDDDHEGDYEIDCEIDYEVKTPVFTGSKNDY